MRPRVMAGMLFFLACVEFTVLMIVAETQYPDYNVGFNYMSDLGVWGEPSAWIFNGAVITFGIAGIAGAFLLIEEGCYGYLPWLFVVSGVGAIGVGIFPEAFDMLHRIMAGIAFGFAALAAVYSYRVLRCPYRYISIIMGSFSLIASFLWISEIFLDLGKGGIERLILYPVLLWMTGFGAILLSGAEGSDEMFIKIK